MKARLVSLVFALTLVSCSTPPLESLPPLRSDVLYFEDHPQSRKVAETVTDLFGGRQKVAIVHQKLPPMIQPSPLTRFAPEFPEEFRLRHLSGEVMVEFIIDENGRVIEAAAIRSTYPELSGPAVEAVRKWTFLPAKREGHPVRTVLQNPIYFTLNESAEPLPEPTPLSARPAGEHH